MLRRRVRSLVLACLVGAALPGQALAAKIELGNYTPLLQSSDFCGGGEAECPFISVLFDPQTSDVAYTKAKLKGFTIQYFADEASTDPLTFTDYKGKQVDRESIQDKLDFDNPSALFLTPVPLGATIARLVPEDLKFHVGGKNGKFATLPLIDLSASSLGTGFYLFDESTEPPPIPEPGLLGLVGLGVLAAVRRARRRR